MPEALSPRELKDALNTLIHWNGDSNGIHRTYTFADFPMVMRFMNDAVDFIEGLNHHPEWLNVYNRLEVSLRTHDAGNQVTQHDLQLAHLLDEHFNSRT